MRYLLDSNLCIAIMNQAAPTRAGLSLNKALSDGSELSISTIVVHELWFGAAKSARVRANFQRVQDLMTEPFKMLDFDGNDARVAGKIRAELAKRGTPIGPCDVLIAGQALARGLTLVTANTREFARIDGLKLVDWTI